MILYKIWSYREMCHECLALILFIFIFWGAARSNCVENSLGALILPSKECEKVLKIPFKIEFIAMQAPLLTLYSNGNITKKHNTPYMQQ